jgi:hypothetical protein
VGSVLKVSVYWAVFDSDSYAMWTPSPSPSVVGGNQAAFFLAA